MRLLVRRLMASTPLHGLSRGLSTSPLHLSSPLPLPSPRETHFWYLVPNEVKDVSLLKQYQELLSPCERQGISCMKESNLQKNALLARVLVRTTLARYTSCRTSPRSLKFRKNEYGKPEVEWKSDDNCVPPSLHFNVSHTSSLIACGVTVDMPIGIDVEEKERKPKNSITSFARRYFSPSEVEYLYGFSDPECQRREFIKLWTLKEAYVKALGRGFSAAPFKCFTIRFEANSCKQATSDRQTGVCYHESIASGITAEVLDDSENLTVNWNFDLFELDGSHYAAVCVKRHESMEGTDSSSVRVKVWETLPLVGDASVMETDVGRNITGLS